MSEAVMVKFPRQDGTTIEAKAFPTHNPNIVVHETLVDEDSPRKGMGFWCVSHLPTGYAFVARLPNREFAEMLAECAHILGLGRECDLEEMEKTSVELQMKIRVIRDFAGEVEDSMFNLRADILRVMSL